MLTELCQYLRNWFNRKPDGSSYPKYFGEFTIADGQLVTDKLAVGQYFRIMGSLFNDGVHKYGDVSEKLTDETFDGAVWELGLPPTIVQLAADIKQWQEKYGGVDSENMSPFASESFAGYSYSKGGGASGGSESDAGTWQGAFAQRLAPWRKI